ncbi:MAG TPA: hypothetical protein PKJ19_13515 [Flavobacteriales bacterium]|nr:hypothetical protein [Flavobacteriales bacterium]
MNKPMEQLKVGDPIRVNNLMTGKTQTAKVAALWPSDKAISVDLKGGKRIYFRSNVMDVYYLPDLVCAS